MSWLIEAFLNEEKLDTEDRNALRDSTFGLPTQRKYPLNDEQHVRSAIAYFNKCDPKDEEELRNNGSYPSGHTIKSWGMAMVLCEINPAAQDALYQLGYEWGQSRVIVGFHWQSDVDASRLLAAACYARLHTCKAFLEDMKAAQKEFKKLTK